MWKRDHAVSTLKFWVKSQLDFERISNTILNPQESMSWKVKPILRMGKELKWHRMKPRICKYYWRTATSTFDSVDIRNQIKHDLGMTIECKNIKEILKNKLNFSFKKWSSRPINIESQRLNLIRTLYVIEFISLWELDTLIINIDEVLFSNKTKKEYSWIQRGRWSNVGNILFSGSTSLIVAITSNGDWFAMFLLINNNVSKFIDFMKKLLLWVKFDLNYDLKKTLVILDNLNIHRAKCTLNLLSKAEASFSIIPAYTPQFAHIELIFNILKKRFIKQSSSRSLKLNKKDAFRAIKEVLTSVDRKEIQKCFNHSFNTMSIYLKDAI